MYQELGLLCVLLLPAALIYFYRSESIDTKPNAPESVVKKAKKKKKKAKGKATNDVAGQKESSQNLGSPKPSTPTDEKPKVGGTTSNVPSRREETGKTGTQRTKASTPLTGMTEEKSTRKQQTEGMSMQKNAKQPEETSTQKSVTQPEQPGKKAEPREIDEHMDLTPKYSRVMRITTEKEDDEWEAVPYEEGWESIGSTKKQIYSAPRESEALSKKQRENQAKAAKKREAKSNTDAIQAERLRRHQKELEKQKINEFYSTGAGKNTPWGKKPQKGSSKVPTSKASLNEHGQLIWD